MKHLKEFLTSRLFLKHLLLAALAFILIIIGVFTFLRIYTHHGQSYPMPDFSGHTFKECKELAQKYDLNVEIEDSLYDHNAPPNTVIEQSPPPGFKVKKGRNVFLTMNASHPPVKEVPMVRGVSLRQAKAVLETHGFEVGTIIYRPDMARNNVLAQKYQGKTISEPIKLYKGTKIDLVLGNGYTTKSINPPDLIGLKYRKARDEIILSSLNVGEKQYDSSVESYRDSVNAYVWKQYPKPSNQINGGDRVNIWLTKDTAKIQKFGN